MNKGYLTTKEVCDHFKFSRVTLYRMIKRGDFPQALLQGNGTNCKWSVEQVEEYEADLYKKQQEA